MLKAHSIFLISWSHDAKAFCETLIQICLLMSSRKIKVDVGVSFLIIFCAMNTPRDASFKRILCKMKAVQVRNEWYTVQCVNCSLCSWLYVPLMRHIINLDIEWPTHQYSNMPQERKKTFHVFYLMKNLEKAQIINSISQSL